MLFIGVEFAGGMELATPMDKATAGPMEKATTGPCTGEAYDGREAWWRGRNMGCRALARSRRWPAEWRHDREGGAVESAVAEATRRSTVAESCRGATMR